MASFLNLTDTCLPFQMGYVCQTVYSCSKENCQRSD